jgi:hypothetical protein
MSADAIDAIARMMSESRRRGKFRGLWCIAMRPRRSAWSLVRIPSSARIQGRNFRAAVILRAISKGSSCFSTPTER